MPSGEGAMMTTGREGGVRMRRRETEGDAGTRWEGGLAPDRGGGGQQVEPPREVRPGRLPWALSWPPSSKWHLRCLISSVKWLETESQGPTFQGHFADKSEIREECFGNS